jgi:hypothetical protein
MWSRSRHPTLLLLSLLPTDFQLEDLDYRLSWALRDLRAHQLVLRAQVSGPEMQAPQ